MTRYIVQFVDKTSMVVSQKEGEQVGQALARGEAIVLHGAYFSPRFISAVKPIDRTWCDKDFVEQQERIEISSPGSPVFLPAPSA